MVTNYKKVANYKKYTISICDNYKVEVQENGNPYVDNVKLLLSNEIAPQVGLRVDPKWNTQYLGRKLVEWINEIENLKGLNNKKYTGKPNTNGKVNVILINVMYSGSYIKNSLGHECINLFATDSDQHFIYINPWGKLAKDKLSKYNIECVLFGQLVRAGVIKVIAKATGLTILDSTKDIINNTNANDQNPLDEKLADTHFNELVSKKVFYDEVFIKDLFDEPTQVLATFEANHVVEINGNVYIYESGKKPETFTDIVLPSAKHDKQKDFHFARTSPYMYFPETNDKGDPMDDYLKLKDIINSRTIWCKNDVNKISSFTSTIPPISMIEIMRKEDSELAYSNMIAYWLNQDKKTIRDFIIKVLKRKDKSISCPNKYSDIIIEREYENIDILINYDNTHIIIENKIKAEISEYDLQKSIYLNQLTKYKEVLKNNFSGDQIYCFLLTPDYRNIDPHKYDKDYSPIKYSDLYDFFSNNKTIKQALLGEEFCKALALHKDVVDNSNFINM